MYNTYERDVQGNLSIEYKILCKNWNFIPLAKIPKPGEKRQGILVKVKG